MPGAERAQRPQSISQGNDDYPDRLIQRIGVEAPDIIKIVGSPAPPNEQSDLTTRLIVHSAAGQS